jgi:hypothetical protein
VVPVDPAATFPDARTVPLLDRVIVTLSEPEEDADEMAAAFAMLDLVKEASTIKETQLGSAGVPVVSSGRYGRIAGAHRNARRGLVEVLGFRK